MRTSSARSANRRELRHAETAQMTEVSDPKTVVCHLRFALGLTQREVADAVGADERTVRRWELDPERSPRGRFVARLDDIRDIVLVLAGSLGDEDQARWLRARNRILEGRRPLDVLGGGDHESVRKAAQAFAEGAYV